MRNRAIVEAVEKLHPKGQRASNGHFYCDPHDCDWAGEGELEDVCDKCRTLWPCPTIAALSSPSGPVVVSGGTE
jgi:hypothetical protein